MNKTFTALEAKIEDLVDEDSKLTSYDSEDSCGNSTF